MSIKIKADYENEIYRKYVAQCLRIITENTAKQVGGSYVQIEYGDIINPKPVDKRTAEEVISDLKEKMKKLNS